MAGGSKGLSPRSEVYARAPEGSRRVGFSGGGMDAARSGGFEGSGRASERRFSTKETTRMDEVRMKMLYVR